MILLLDNYDDFNHNTERSCRALALLRRLR